MELSCCVQTYAWGKLGSSSQVARLAAGKACMDFTLKEETNYAELWMGIHPNGPARIISDDQLLSDFIAKNPDCLGSKIQSRFGDTLPFLFKVLSVNKALSIQAHPNKSHAEQLHAERPSIYKDPNHKPEIAVALTQFEGLCGFRPLEEIKGFLAAVPELREVTDHESLLSSSQENYTAQLRLCFESLMTCKPEVLKEQLRVLESRLSSGSGNDPVSALFLRLHEQYPGDVGCFVIYFLNHLQLTPGEAMFLGPNVPHAYLAGDCVEVMANSDNVVRAGLTPKLIDVPTLVNMLDYTCTDPDTRKFSPDPELSSDLCLEFDPPVPDFSVGRYEVPGEKDSYQLKVRDTASIVLVIEGSGKYLASRQITRKGGISVVEPFASDDISPGSVLFLAADKILEVFPENCSKLVLFQAYCNL